MYRIGDLIKDLRIKQGVSQEELAYRICTTSNLSKIENNLQIPTQSNFEAMMQKLGQPHDVFIAVMDEEEEKRYQIRYDIKNCLLNGEYTKAAELINVLKNNKDLDCIYKQFVIYADSILLEEADNNYEDAIKGYQQALNMTLKEFKHEHIVSYLLTMEEINIIYRIAKNNSILGDKETAVSILYSLIKYFSVKILHMSNYLDTYLMIHKELSECLNDLRRHEESIIICDKGIEHCKRYSKLKVFPFFVYHRGCGFYGIGKVTEAKKAIVEAYNMFEAISNLKGLHMVQGFMEKNDVTNWLHN